MLFRSLPLLSTPPLYPSSLPLLSTPPLFTLSTPLLFPLSTPPLFPLSAPPLCPSFPLYPSSLPLPGLLATLHMASRLGYLDKSRKNAKPQVVAPSTLPAKMFAQNAEYVPLYYDVTNPATMTSLALLL